MSTDERHCELCGGPGEMEFYQPVSISLDEFIMITGAICLTCYGKYTSDLAIAFALLRKRGEVA